MPIVPDDKDWTWVLQRPCPECGFDASALAPEGVAPLLRADNVRPGCASWNGRPTSSVAGRRTIAGHRSSTPATSVTSACTTAAVWS